MLSERQVMVGCDGCNQIALTAGLSGMAFELDAVRDSYDRMAPFYDAFTDGHDYERWTRTLERLARRHGLRGRRLLDVGCGTGKSFLPFLARGYSVVACDISREMARRAAGKAPGVDVHVCDARALPRLGSFDLVSCLDDCLNHVLDREGLRAAFTRIAANLGGDGIALFDLNTLATYRGFFATTSVVEHDDLLLIWRGRTSAEAEAGVLARADLLAYRRRTGECWERSAVRHAQRHHVEGDVRSGLAAAGLECVGVFGHGLDGIPHEGVDEDVDTKAVYLARHAR
jgi:SAM-dependent methyltransferase